MTWGSPILGHLHGRAVAAQPQRWVRPPIGWCRRPAGFPSPPWRSIPQGGLKETVYHSLSEDLFGTYNLYILISSYIQFWHLFLIFVFETLFWRSKHWCSWMFIRCSDSWPIATNIFRNVLFQMPLQSYGPTFYPQQNHRGNPSMEKTWRKLAIFDSRSLRNQPPSGDQPWLCSREKPKGICLELHHQLRRSEDPLVHFLRLSKDGWMIFGMATVQPPSNQRVW